MAIIPEPAARPYNYITHPDGRPHLATAIRLTRSTDVVGITLEMAREILRLAEEAEAHNARVVQEIESPVAVASSG
jgi:hypothetical protein